MSKKPSTFSDIVNDLADGSKYERKMKKTVGSFSSVALDVGKAALEAQQDVVDIITFIESSWGLNQKLFPVQRIILKAHYGICLDDNPWGLDLDMPVPLGHPMYDEITSTTGSEKGFYKYRIRISGWRRKKWQVMSEADYLRMLYHEGRSNIQEVVEGNERREMILSVGRRSGKTQIAAFIAAYETYKLISKGSPQTYYGLPLAEMIGLISLATDQKQAGLLYSKVSGYFKKCDFFRPYMANNTMSYAKFQTPADIDRYGRYEQDQKAHASIEVTFAPCRGAGTRGPGNILIILDEMAHFRTDGQSSAETIYEAISPSKAAFAPKHPDDPHTAWDPKHPETPTDEVEVEGRLLAISSPMGKEGMFYKLFMIGMSDGPAAANMLCIQAPTWEVNPTIPASEFAVAAQKDINVFMTEFGGKFTSRTRGWIEHKDDLLACIAPNHRPASRAPSRRPHFVGLDFALAGDGTAISIGHVDNGKIILDHMDWIRAGHGDYENYERLDFDEVADWVLGLSKKFNFASGLFDQWAGIVFEQALAKRGLRQLVSSHFTEEMSSRMFRNFKDMMWDQRLVLFDHPLPPPGSVEQHCGYIEELLGLQATMKSKYITKVAAPKIKGKHDDRSDALVRMVWQASLALGKDGYIAGSHRRSGGKKSRMSPAQIVQARRKLGRAGGSTSERQVSSIHRGRVRGRY